MAINSVGFLSQINRTNRTYNSILNKVASGSRYPNASYGTSAYAIAVRAYSNIGALNQSNANAQNANAMLATAAGGVSSTVSALTSLREQVVQAANGTNSPSDIATLNNSINQTLRTIDENASIQYNGMNLLDGSQGLTVAGTNGYTNFNIPNLSSQALGLSDGAGNSLVDITSQQGLANALGTARQVDASGNVTQQEVVGQIDAALNRALDAAASIGAAQQNLNFSSANYTTQSENLTSAVSTMSDTDMAKAITEMNSADTQNKLAIYAQKMFMHNNASVLSLLQQ